MPDDYFLAFLYEDPIPINNCVGAYVTYLCDDDRRTRKTRRYSGWWRVNVYCNDVASKTRSVQVFYFFFYCT